MHRFAVMTRRQKLAVGGICLILLTVAFYFYMGAGKQNGQRRRRRSARTRVFLRHGQNDPKHKLKPGFI